MCRITLAIPVKKGRGIFVLFALIILCVFIPFLYPYSIKERVYDDSKFNQDIARLKLQHPDSLRYKRSSSNDEDERNFGNNYVNAEKNPSTKNQAEVFYFDPNTASFDDWERLGLRDKTITTIQKYLSKGGRFYKPDDISKIWGLHPEDIKRLSPYVRIQKKDDGFAKNISLRPSYPGHDAEVRKTVQFVEVNTSDTTAFIGLPGIGSKLAQRIVNFRNKLGGFYSIEQVGETFGLPDSTYQKIRPLLIFKIATIKRININIALLDELKNHPYIRYAIANAIIQYRTQHGNFSSVSDLKKIMMITEDIYNKIEPYVTI